MLAQRFRSRVDFHLLTQTRDARGQLVDTWAPDATDVPAEVMFLSGTEFIAAGAQQNSIVARITVRRGAFTEGPKKVRVVRGTEVFNVQAIMPDPKERHYLTLHVTRGASLG